MRVCVLAIDDTLDQQPAQQAEEEEGQHREQSRAPHEGVRRKRLLDEHERDAHQVAEEHDRGDEADVEHERIYRLG